MTLALARKYRPKSFADVAVQTHVSNTLKGAIARGRVAHGYLLCGPRGTGKTTLARVLAMALNCERRAEPGTRGAPGEAGSWVHDGEPCGACESCRRIWAGSSSLDVVEIDAASNRSVDDARDLRERAMYAPSGEDRYKVYIVDEAHMLTREAWNALLKILEEPPPRVVFVFCTTEPQKIAQAAAPILSRLQRFDLRRIGPAEIRTRLAAVLDAEGIAYEGDALGIIARAADGGLRDALSLTDQVLSLGQESAVTAERVREALGLVPEDEYLATLDIVAGGRAGDVFAQVARLAEAGVDFALFLAGLGDALRALLALSLGGAAPDVSERLRAELAARVPAGAPGYLAAADVLRMLQLLVEAEPRIRRGGQPQLLLETLLVRFSLADRVVTLESLLRGLDGGRDGGADGGTPPAPNGGGRTTGGVPNGSRVAAARPVARPADAHRADAQSADVPADVPAAIGGLRAAFEGAIEDARVARADSAVARPRANGVASTVPVSVPVSVPVTVVVTHGVREAATAPSAIATEGAAGIAPTATLEWAPIEDDGLASDADVAPHTRNGAAPDRPAPARGDTRDARPPRAEAGMLARRWADVVEAARAVRPLVATALAAAAPLAVSGAGVVTIELREPNEAYAQAITAAQADVLAAVRRVAPEAARVVLRASDATAGAAPQRLTAEGVRAERLTMLAERDAVLGAAIAALDLDLVE